ncbi:hypothetical protein EPN83_01220 [Patescibacteria group bacterium]|nr:MAG: hypothetical protein EPN83_01220 [Patescibacteria group bacterium]
MAIRHSRFAWLGNRKVETGQAMILAVLFFVFISLAILLGISGPVLRQVKIVSDLLNSRESYFLAEAGMEDVVYRLKNRLPVSSSGQMLTISGQSAAVDTVDSAGEKVVTATANWSGRIRKVETRLTTGVGVSFNYGVQVGNGGFEMENNSGVIGSIYANGNISGQSGTYVTGDAIAANSIPLTLDQSNITPTPPPNWINFRNSSASQDVAQKFQVSTTSLVNKAQFYIKKVGSPSNATVRIVTSTDGNNPSNTKLASGTLSASQVTANYSLVDVVFTSNPQLAAGTDYWLVIDSSTQSSSNYFVIGANVAYSNGDAKVGQYGGSWSDPTPSPLDIYFTISLGGLSATISGVTVGTGVSGDAWAHTVNNSTIGGNLYCQTGSGNNKPCNTSKPDPSPQQFPVSDGNITQWKEEASGGGVINGDFTATTSAIGPVKITGNLTVTNGAVLTVAGTVWVAGNINVSNNAQVKLFSSYGSNSGVVVTDGRVLISNNTVFSGSGQLGSYIMVLTTSDCPISSSCGGARAIDISNNAGAVILNAQRGAIEFENNASAKEAVAYKMELENNATITYETGLVNVNFSSGPSGGWDILSWNEVE